MKKTISFVIISLMAFCTFAQDLYIGSFYVTTEEEEKQFTGGDTWQSRRNAIVDMFNFEQPDVLGLQSLSDTQRSYLTRYMTNFKAAENILYNKTTLTLDTCAVVEDMPEGSTCSWARLRKGEKAFYVFNICFSSTQTIASSSSTSLINAIGKVNTDGLPCFIVGDLGVNETKTAYTRLNTRYPDTYTKAATVSAEYGTKNNFDLAANHGTERYDFVFASKTVSVKAYGQLQYAYYTSESGGGQKRRLPSSHFPVMAKVTLP
jgi:hypothetical protein